MTAALTLAGLGVSFDGFRAVDGVDLVVEAGECRLLLGANGAGKTTLMDLVSGKTRSTAGTVRLGETDITGWSETHRARAGLGRKFQIPSVFREMTVMRNLEVASCRHPGVLANLRLGLPPAARARITEVLDTIGLSAASGTIAGLLSHGQTQWLELGLLLVQNPAVLLLDEPTAGMTAAETRRTADIIRSLRPAHTVIVVEHDMEFVRDIAERITVLHLGRVLAEGDLAAIERNPAVRAAYLGEAIAA